MKTGLMRIPGGMGRLTRKWWFYVILTLLVFIPAYTSKPYHSAESARVVIAVLSNAVIFSWKALFPLFKIIPLLLFGMLALIRDKGTRAFHFYAGANLLLIALFENMAVTAEYGFAILVGNVVISLLVAASWLWEGIVKQSDFTEARPGIGRLWVLPLAFMAFWYPINMGTLLPDFRLHYLVTSEAGLTFCMMLPVYLTVLIMYYPRVNMVTLRISSFAGIVIGALSMMQFFALNRGMGWMGTLHLPLLVISIYAFALAVGRNKKATASAMKKAATT